MEHHCVVESVIELINKEFWKFIHFVRVELKERAM